MPPLVRIVPTLDDVRAVYDLPTAGGVQSARFEGYKRAIAEKGRPLWDYNPMSGSAPETVDALLALDAEEIARQAATALLERCAFAEFIEMKVVVKAPGMWTDRSATEIEHRFGPQPACQGTVMLWAREPVSREKVVAETEAEVVRVMWRAVHPAPVTVRSCIGREGLADAVGTLDRRVDTPLLDHEATNVADAIEIFGDSLDIVDMASVLYGDDVAAKMGWTPLGLADRAGYRWAASAARAALAEIGPVEALYRPWIPLVNAEPVPRGE